MAFNWEEYRTHMILTASGTILVILLYSLTPVGAFIVAPWTLKADVATALEYATNHPGEVEIIINRLREETVLQDKQIGKLLKYHERDFHLIGTGSVGLFGASGDEPCIRVNRRSRAWIYKEGDKVKVTVNDIEGKPSAILEVKGTFSDSNQDLIISFSKQASAVLGLTHRVEVEIEPVVNGDQ